MKWGVRRLLSLVLGAAAIGSVGTPTVRSQQADKPATAAPAPAPPADFDSLSDLAEVTLEGITFVKVPAGQFMMGTTDAQLAMLKSAGLWQPLNEDERPAHRVTISHPFLMGK